MEENKYPILGQILEQAILQLDKDDAEKLVKEMEEFKFEAGIAYAREFVDAVKDSGLTADRLSGILEGAIADVKSQ